MAESCKHGLAAIVLALVFCLAGAERLNADELAPLTLDRLFETPSLFGVAPSMPAWSPDSQHVAFAWNDSGMPHRGLWVASRDGSGLQRLDGGPDSSPSVREVTWLESGTILSLRGTAVWSTSLDDGRDAVLVEIGAGAHHLSIAPDGSQLAYLQDGDLWLVDLEDLGIAKVTDVGIPGLSAIAVGRYNRPEREIGTGIWGGPTYSWSPDSQHIAVHHVDRQAMRRVPFPDYLADETDPNEVRRGYPGDPNESRSVGIINVATQSLELLEIGDPAANQVVGFAWSPDGVLLLDMASDTAVDRWLYVMRPGERPRQVWHDSRDSRIYTSFASAWHPDGRHVVFLSDLGDRYGLYSLDANAEGPNPERLTNPDIDVLAAPSVVASANSVFYPTNGVSPYEQHVYRLDTTTGAEVQATNIKGQNSGIPSPDGRYLAFLHSDDQTPTELYVVAANGDGARRVTNSPPPEFSERQWARARYVTFPSRVDDYTLHARILEPVNLRPGHKYPVLFGPMYSNTARDRWRGIYGAVQQLMVQKGYIVVQVDVRGSTGYGRAFREEFLVDFAGDDLEDIESAVDYIMTLPYVDANRLGIWGSSYGGTLTLYTLLKKPGLFHAGVAAASAVDPEFFGTDDVAIVRRPDTHPDVFEHKAMRYAANLEDHLLLIHGMQDQVVPFKTIAELADALIREGKDFDTAFVAGATHSWSREPYYGRYLWGKLLEHFDRYLMTAPVTDPD